MLKVLCAFVLGERVEVLIVMLAEKGDPESLLKVHCCEAQLLALFGEIWALVSIRFLSVLFSLLVLLKELSPHIEKLS